MCGIAGILRLTAGESEYGPIVRQMVNALATRGPDSTGFKDAAPVFLGHARLSIIDLTGGDQPIHNESRTVWTVFNGEIFNYLELRDDLIRKGHTFYTQTDTEVIVHLYEEYGDEFVQHLNGQFAIALWDEPRARLLLARDRPGILPLFFFRQGDRLAFASEVKALLPAMHARPTLNPRALDQIMTFWCPASPNTLFDGVEEVSSGEIVTVENGNITRKRYWDWEFPTDGEYLPGSDDSLTAALHDLLVDATQIRLRSDVPVGAYLSGGLDSSGITALIKAHGNVPLRTFSIGFADSAVDETAFQQAMVAHLQSDHSSIRCSHGLIAERFEHAIWRTEVPILRTAPVPMSLLSGLVREQGFKVVLTGEGADEVLGGYDIFKETKIRQFWAKHPDSRFRAALLKRLYPYLELQQLQSSAYLKSFFGQGLEAPDLPYFSHIPRWSTTARIKEFYSADMQEQLHVDSINDFVAHLPPALPRWHSFNRAQYLEAKTLLSGYLLCSQGDRMLMANSIEGRFPFLDHRIIEFANRLHPRFKMRGLNEKFLLKRALKPYLPETTSARHKQPYRAPDIASFFDDQGNCPEYVRERLSRSAIQEAGYFNPDRVDRLLTKIAKGRAIGFKDNMAFVGMLSTQIWHRHFINDFSTNRQT